MIECRGVSFSYGRRARPVFEGFDWATNNGVTFLLGPNGAGKSTLMKLLIGALEPQDGQILLDGRVRPSKRKAGREWRRRIGWVPQQAEQVAGLTVLEQVAYCGWLKGLGRAEAVRRAGEAIERVKPSSGLICRRRHRSAPRR
ncbi:ATP-binding cassette domain-containing protein [Luteococcus sp. OSA5]|uniref:ATP-binding cassette domain-containing protein n=1 Tax=Luteococcus sp. OSA5 TaxID=3401630 RepID=UPI003B427999